MNDDFHPRLILDPNHRFMMPLGMGGHAEGLSYEHLLNLDEGIINPVPKRLFDMLPIQKFSEANK